ncbi:hypothetical protein BS47DRAFT_1295810 [Hydnum rufescens UP504]|uniref:Pentatricopeptide repeat-containing protein n=1 Tax=Hydnum rufescens UP504 TaxID=1448309 RepID=A0A9P6DXD0_9AGAM|nr:hypothetical protein BS47DRAFT_1295810 [Hydnum rufescens UP504]
MVPILWSKTETLAEKILGGDDEARGRFYQFLDDVKIVRLVARPFVVLRYFTQLFENGDHTVAIKACGDLIRAVASSSPWIAPTDTEGWNSDGRYLAAVTEPLWSVILSGLMRANRKDLARSVWKLMDDLGVKRGTIVWNALLDGYGKAGQYEELKAVWDGMNQHHVPKDIFSYTSMISSLFQLRKSSEATLLFEEMRRALLHASTSGSLTVAYNAVIHGLLICAQPKIAQSVLEDMKIHGPKPDITTYNTFLRHYSRKRETAAFTAILRDIPTSGLQPDVVTFTMMLQLFIRSGKHQGVDRLNQAMSSMGVSPNVVSYSAIIDSVIRKGGESNMEAGLALLRQMEDRGLAPNEVTFTAILAALRRDVSLTPAFVEHKREEIMNRMRQTGIHFNRVTFNVLIKACLERPGREGLTSAVDKYREMIGAGVNPTDDTFYMLLLGAWTRRQLDIGYDLVEEMERIGFVPQNAVAELVDSIRKDGMSTSFTF